MFRFLRRLRRRLPAAPPSITLEPTPPVDAATLAEQRTEAETWPDAPRFSVLLPVYRPPVEVLRAAVESVVAQSYPHWELCVVYDVAEPARAYLESLTDARVRRVELAENRGIADNSNAALEVATGDYVALLDHDDAYAADALFQMAKAIQERPHLDVVYSDKDSFGIHTVLKPEWSPDLMWSSSYLTHLSVLRTALVRDVGGFRKECEGAQDWDLFLRVITRSTSVQHVPRVLYHWRIIEGSTSMGIEEKPYVADAQLRALHDHAQRLRLAAEVVYDTQQQTRLRWQQPERQSVSVVYIGADGAAVEALRQRTRYAAFEVKGVEGRSTEAIAAAVRKTTGQCVVLLDRHVRPLHEAWLQDLVPFLQLDAIGAVMPMLLDPYTHQIRQAGFAFARNGELYAPFVKEPVGRYGMLGRNDWYRNWSALYGGCLAMRREAYEAAGGFSAGAAWHPRPDVDLSLRLQYRAGLRLLLNPMAQCEQAREAWCDVRTNELPPLFPEGDPFYHPLLDATAVGPVGAGEVEAIAVDAGARDVAWRIPTGMTFKELRPALERAETMRRDGRVRSWFVLQGPVPAAMWRQRLAAWYPRLAADASFRAIPVRAVYDVTPSTPAGNT